MTLLFWIYLTGVILLSIITLIVVWAVRHGMHEGDREAEETAHAIEMLERIPELRSKFMMTILLWPLAFSLYLVRGGR